MLIDIPPLNYAAYLVNHNFNVNQGQINRKRICVHGDESDCKGDSTERKVNELVITNYQDSLIYILDRKFGLTEICSRQSTKTLLTLFTLLAQVDITLCCEEFSKFVGYALFKSTEIRCLSPDN